MNIEEMMARYVPQSMTGEAHGNVAVFEAPAAGIVRLCSALYYESELPLKIVTAFDERKFECDAPGTAAFRIMYVFGVPDTNAFLAPYILVDAELGEFPSLTPMIHEASIYERKIMTFFGLTPVGHPNSRRLILHENWPGDVYPLRKDFDWRQRPQEAKGEFQFRRLDGEGIYEIPVGPVHAGIIEPGHFRFSVAGEEILLLEPRLGYSHKGSEKLFEVLPLKDKIRLAERVSGDSSFSHALAFCQALETLGGAAVPERDSRLRVALCELERLANHLGDIGAIMTDTGYNFGGSQCSRLRESVMQVCEDLTGSRFLRGAARVGGVQVRADAAGFERIAAFMDSLAKDFSEVMEVVQNSNSLVNRLRNTGMLPLSVARDHGVLGVPAKAVGIGADARRDFPYAAYGMMEVEVATEETGDVEARFLVRISEVHSSIGLVREALDGLPAAEGETPAAGGFELKPDSFAVGIVEGWRGDIVYIVATDAGGEISRVDMRDPSFLNWTALGYAGQENMVPDFPLINKSFNLSYSGNDL